MDRGCCRTDCSYGLFYQGIASTSSATEFYFCSLVGFAAFKDHYSFFVMSKVVMQAFFQEELKPYKTATATVHFAPEKPLPESLVTAIVEARMPENEEMASKKKIIWLFIRTARFFSSSIFSIFTQ